MEVENIVQVISTVGFPIVCCIALGYFIVNELKELRTAINNNTLVIQKLLDKLDADDDEKR